MSLRGQVSLTKARLVSRWWGLVFHLLLALTARAAPTLTWQHDPVLSQVLVQQMVTDHLGYRWVATDEGVFRYDGYELVPLRKLL